MPLKLKLGANERLVVNGAVLVNGAYRTTILVENFAHIMREKDVLQMEDANTPTRRLYFLVQAMLMQATPSEPVLESYREVHAQLLDAFLKPENVAILHAVDELVGTGDFYKALVKLHPLITYEAKLLNVKAHEWRRRNQPPREVIPPFVAREAEHA